MRINFSSTSQEFEPLPNGTNLSEVESMEVGKSSTGNPKIKTTFKIHDVDGGRKLWDEFSLLPQSGWKLKDFLEKAQVPHSAMPLTERGSFEIDFNTEDAIGAKVVIRHEQESYDSKQTGQDGKAIRKIKNEVKEYLKA